MVTMARSAVRASRSLWPPWDLGASPARYLRVSSKGLLLVTPPSTFTVVMGDATGKFPKYGGISVSISHAQACSDVPSPGTLGKHFGSGLLTIHFFLR